MSRAFCILTVLAMALSGCASALTSDLALELHDRTKLPPGLLLTGQWSHDITFPQPPSVP